MPVEEHWQDEPEEHDFPAAADYLSLVAPADEVEKVVEALRSAETIHRKAKDLLRASRLALLPADNVHVKKDLARSRPGKRLSPVLLVRGRGDKGDAAHGRRRLPPDLREPPPRRGRGRPVPAGRLALGAHANVAPRCRLVFDCRSRRKGEMSEYQVVKLEDVEDWLGDYPGEMRGITYAIGAEQVAITYRRMPQHTGSKGSYGHRHKTQEEIYFVVAGRLQFKLGEDVIELGEHEAIRVPPQTWRGIWNDEPDDAELIIVSTRVDDPSGDGETLEDFWPL